MKILFKETLLMEVLVRSESGFRFSATCRGHTVTAGRGEDGNTERDGMWPAQLFEASLGMCIGAYIVKYCNEQKIPYDDLTIELSRRMETSSSPATSADDQRTRTAKINAKILLSEKLSPPQQQGILNAASLCHITRSIEEGIEIICSLAEFDDA